MDKPEATATVKQDAISLSDVQTLLEGIADSLNAIETRTEKLEDAVDDVKADTEEILNQLENLSFKADYPGLSDE